MSFQLDTKYLHIENKTWRNTIILDIHMYVHVPD